MILLPRLWGRRRSSARPQQIADDVGCVSVAGFEEVGVHVQGGGSVRVAESAAHGSHRHAGSQQLGGMEVSKVVEPCS